jgi:hypothetical protein
MNVTQSKTSKPKRSLAKKLALAFVGVSSVAIVGSAGVAAAASPQTRYMPSRAVCDHQFSQFGFKNPNACGQYWDKHKHDHGHGHGNNGGGNGYGGNNAGGVTVIVGGSNNTVNIVINYFFGS